ncbi:MAG TPA: Tim44-like domain-containing protein [Pseudomonadales bacterium]|nr:Tim44-like domain-containing protein [Pseudomonadales bacterium]
MRSLWALVAVLMLAVFGVSEAEAKKLGSGKSFGKSYQTAPSQSAAAKNTPDAANPAAAGAGAAAGAAASAKKGLLGGLLGGLLVGGLIASLFGGAFEGLQLMDVLILGGLAFLLFKLFRRRAASAPMAYAGAGAPAPQPQPSEQWRQAEIPVAGSASPARTQQVPFNLSAGFDVDRFLVGAREHYQTLQTAWNQNDLAKIREYVSDEIFYALQQERAALEGPQQTEVLFLQAEIVRAEQLPGKAELSVKFSGEYRDRPDGLEQPITDIWHLERDLTVPDAPWMIVGIDV